MVRLLLPIIALLTFCATLAINSLYNQAAYVHGLTLGAFAFCLILWLTLNRRKLPTFFRQRIDALPLSYGSVLFYTLIILLLGLYLSTRPRLNHHFDLTKSQKHSLSPQALDLIGKLDERGQTVTIHGYFLSAKIAKNFRDLVDLYLAHNAPFVATFYDPQVDLAQAQKDGITRSQEVYLTNGPKTTYLSTFNERSFNSALLVLARMTAKSVCFVAKDLSEPVEDVEILQNELKALGYEVIATDLKDQTAVSACDMIAWVNPHPQKVAAHAAALGDYLALPQKGLLISMRAFNAAAAINTFAKPWHLAFNQDLLVLAPDDPRLKMVGQNTIFAHLSQPYLGHTELTAHLIAAQSIHVGPGADQATDPRQLATLAVSEDDTVQVSQVTTENDLISVADTRVKAGAFPILAKSLNATTGSQLILLGSGSLLARGAIEWSQNKALALALFSDLCHDETFPDLPKRAFKASLSLTSKGAIVSLSFIAFFYPALMLLAGVLLRFKRGGF